MIYGEVSFNEAQDALETLQRFCGSNNCFDCKAAMSYSTTSTDDMFNAKRHYECALALACSAFSNDSRSKAKKASDV